MTLLPQILTCTRDWLVLWFGCLTLAVTSTFQWISWQVLWVLLCRIIGMQGCVSCGIWIPLQVLGFSIQQTMTSLRLLPCLDGQIEIGRAMWILVVLPPATILHWAWVLSPGVARNSQPLHFHLLKQSIGLLALGLAKRCGFCACLEILVFLNKPCHLYCLTIKVVLQLLAI